MRRLCDLVKRYSCYWRSDKTVYHFVFQSDFGQLNFWVTIIKIMVERFIIYNTADKGKDQSLKKKSIKTFLFILKNNDYELLIGIGNHRINTIMK